MGREVRTFHRQGRLSGRQAVEKDMMADPSEARRLHHNHNHNHNQVKPRTSERHSRKLAGDKDHHSRNNKKPPSSPSNLTILDDLQHDDDTPTPGAVRAPGPGPENAASPHEDESSSRQDDSRYGDDRTAGLILDTIVDTTKQQQDASKRTPYGNAVSFEATTTATMVIDEDEDFRRQVEEETKDKILKDLALAEAMNDDTAISFRNKRRWMTCGAVLLLLAIAMVVAGVIVAHKLKGSNHTSPAKQVTARTIAPGPVNTSLSQDLCSNAMELTLPQTTMGTTVHATADVGVPVCGTLRSNGIGVWYFLQGTGVPLRVDTCQNTNFDTQISVFQGSDCGHLQCVGANDQRTDYSENGSHLTFLAETGKGYYILVDGNRNSVGIFSLRVEPQIVNDQCTNAIRFNDTRGTTVPTFGTTKFSSFHEFPMCNNVPHTAPSAWFVFQATETHFVQAEVEDMNGRISVYTGSCLELQCVTASNEGRALWTAQNGTHYFIAVHGGGSTVGDFTLLLQPGGLLKRNPNATSNYQCDTATFLARNHSNDPMETQVLGNTADGIVVNVPLCGSNQVGSTAKGVWYSLMGSGTAMEASTCHSNEQFEAQISVFTGNCSNLQCVDGGNQNCGVQSTVEWRAEPGRIYYILVQGHQNQEGQFQLHVKDFIPSAALTCAVAIVVDVNGPTILGPRRDRRFNRLERVWIRM